MFGNKLGWGISAVIVVLTACGLILIGRLGEISAPGEIGREGSSWTIELPIAPESAVQFMNDGANASVLYQQAVVAYEASPESFEAYDRIRTAAAPEVARLNAGIEPLIRARVAREATVFQNDPAQVIHYDPRRPKLTAIRILGKAAIHLGLLHQQANPQAAREHFEAAYALGARLYRERLTYGELDVAMELLGQAAIALSRVNVSESTRLTEFDRARVDFFNTSIKPVRDAVLALDPHPGDLFALADHAGDRMWRVEAILALGRCKFSAVRRADQQGARLRLEQLANSSDPAIREAAVAARDLTIEAFRQLR